MAIPDYETLMLPVLKLANESPVVSMREATSEMVDRFKLSEEERAAPIPSGGQTTISNRTHWAVTYMVKAGLLERPKHGHFTITERGRELLAQNPDRIDKTNLNDYPEFIEFRSRTNTLDQPEKQQTEQLAVNGRAPRTTVGEDGTPEERIAAANEELNAELRSSLLTELQKASPTFFEHVIVDLMRSMGYGDAGNSQHLGKTGDGGIDGIINEDPLGLDVVLLQAKRYGTGNVVWRYSGRSGTSVPGCRAGRTSGSRLSGARAPEAGLPAGQRQAGQSRTRARRYRRNQDGQAAAD